jgi:sulfur-carrier protein
VIRVVLPAHLRALAGLSGEVVLDLPSADAAGPLTRRGVLDAVEARHPVLRGTMRDPVSGSRRPFVRFYACREDLSLASPDDPLPPAVLRGEEPLLVVGAMAGG